MINLRNHIALLLFGVFFFPILFQSVHFVRHHSHDYNCEHYLCHQTIADINFHTNGENLSEEVKKCLICEYHFSINELPEISVSGRVIPSITCIYNEIVIQQQHKQVISIKVPRAPPVYLS